MIVVAHALLGSLAFLLAPRRSASFGAADVSRFLASAVAVAMSPWAAGVVVGFWLTGGGL